MEYGLVVAHYKDFYGSVATIKYAGNGKYRLVIYCHHTVKSLDRTYSTIRGAKIAMGKYGDCWHEL